MELNSVNRDNLSDLVQQFLAAGGEVKSCETREPTPRTKPTVPSVVAKSKKTLEDERKRRRDPLSVPISLGERSRLPEVKSAMDRGLSFTEVVQELGITRAALIRIAHEYELSWRGKRMSDKQVLAAVIKGVKQGRSITAICMSEHTSPWRGRALYMEYRKTHPDAPPPPRNSGRGVFRSDEEVLQIVLAGLESGQTINRILVGAGVCPNRGKRLYADYLETKKGKRKSSE